MKRKYLLLPIFVMLICLTACKQPNMEHTGPLNTNSGTSSSKVQTCKKSHSFTDDSHFCTLCGADYYAETLAFTLSDTKDYYIVSGIGTCTRTVIVIPETYKGKTVAAIAENAFLGVKTKETRETYERCREIMQIVLPDTITKIGECAFSDCVALESINIPHGVTELPKEIFANCVALKSVQLPEGLCGIGEHAFTVCKALESISLPATLIYIGKGAFSNCEALNILIVPESVIEIGANAFAKCKMLTYLQLPKDLKVLPNGMIGYCTSLESIRIPVEVTAIPDGFAMECTALKTVEFQGAITTVGQHAFMNCSSLTDLQLPNTVNSIEWDAFTGCRALYRVYEGMAYVGNDENPYMVLIGKADVTKDNVIIHNDTKVIAAYAFHKNRVASLFFGEKLEFIGTSAFFMVEGVKTVGVAEGNTRYHASGNCIIETETKTLIRGGENPIIPDDGSVTVIANQAFGYLTETKVIVVPDSITRIGSNAFMYCENLEAVVIGSGLASIGGDILIHSDKCSMVFYHGTKAQLQESGVFAETGGFIGGNSDLLAATWYFYSETPPTEEGNYWRYVDGIPTPWEAEE